MTTAEDVLAAGGPPREPYDLNGTKIYLQALGLDEYGPWLKGGELQADVKTITRLLSRSIVNEHGQRLFSNANSKKLGNLEPRLALDMFMRVLSLSGLSSDAQEDIDASFGTARNGDGSTA